MPITVIDLFAGPGGLGEGFSSCIADDNKPRFKIKLSIEKDAIAHETLKLRAFFRQFHNGKIPEEYFDYLANKISAASLFNKYPVQSKRAEAEAWLAELGNEAKTPKALVDARIRSALERRVNWVLIGGPPCQAYSLVGRARRTNDQEFEKDEKHFLYRQYLRILAVHRPPVFVMENVKGLLSAKVNEEHIFRRILSDLKAPIEALPDLNSSGRDLRYRLFSLTVDSVRLDGEFEPRDFVIEAEHYGIPQARHRVIILGIRSDFLNRPALLVRRPKVGIEEVIADLPRLRSGLSREEDNSDKWIEAVKEISRASWFGNGQLLADLRRELMANLGRLCVELNRGESVGKYCGQPRYRPDWFVDTRLLGVCNHESRSHIRSDLHRYFYAASYARVVGRSPRLEDFPESLHPRHKNVNAALEEPNFNDRFRVQIKGRPSTTVVSHISKDGHYFIHYDPTQCRSLTVREAARLQTFPDNYFFEGPRTHQYHQVGNAVPPLLANQIAEIVAALFE